MATQTSTEKKLNELYELIDQMHIAMMTTRRSDGQLVTRPMETQDRGPKSDLWFVTSIDTHKIEEIQADPHVSIGYYNDSSKEWVSVSGTATITQDRELIHELYSKDWKMWFPYEGGNCNGGPDDPRLALILVEATSVIYSKAKHTKPVQLFELAKGYATGQKPDLARQEKITPQEM